MDFGEFPSVDQAARTTSVFCDRCARLARASGAVSAGTLCTCARCGAQFTRACTRGRPPKFCDQCVSPAKREQKRKANREYWDRRRARNAAA